MADNTILNPGTGGDTIATDDLGGGVKVQRVKVQFGTDGAAADVNSSSPLPVQDQSEISDNSAFADGTTKLTPIGYVFDEVAGTALTENDLAAARINLNRAQVHVLEDGATRGRYVTVTSVNALKVDGSAVTQPVSMASGAITVVGGGAEASALRVTLANDTTGVLTVKQATAANLNATVVQATAANLKATVIAAGDVAHDTSDSGNPTKVGGVAASALPAAVSSGDRANLITDLRGRLMTTFIDPSMQKWTCVTYIAQVTGVTIMSPSGGKRLAVTHAVLSTGGSTSGRATLWYGSSGDTTYTEATDQIVLDVEFAPSSSSYPGAIICPMVPIYCQNADYYVKLTTSAVMTIHIQVYGFEY